MKDSFPKILVASPTSINKDYCFDQWIDNVFSFTYPNFDCAFALLKANPMIATTKIIPFFILFFLKNGLQR